MGHSSIENFINFPHQNGFLTFTLGILFVLTIYHFLLYFQHRDELYFLYSGYTLFIFLSQIQWLDEGFIFEIINPSKDWQKLSIIFTETYYILYILFAFKFLNIKRSLPKWHMFNMWVLYFIISFCLGKLLLFILGNSEILYNGYFIFTILISVFALVLYIPFFKSKTFLKYYIIVGSIMLFVTSITSLLYYLNLKANNKSVEPAYSILYLGFILENIIFSLGLGHKQKRILDERDTSKNQLINQLKENEELRSKMQKQLINDVEQLNRQAEIEKLEVIKMKYDKELAELKVTALRSQMNPHFIFNSLNAIKRYIIDSEKENAVFYLNKFSKLIRKILNSTENNESTLAEELDTLKLYLNIENLRFNNSINISFECDTSINLSAIQIPSLITQPFIENAIWHGLSLKKENRKLIIRVIHINESQVRIEIIDNGIGREKSKELKENKIHKKESLGIKLSQERLQQFCKKYTAEGFIEFEDLIESNMPSGTKVSITLPLQ